MLYAAIKNQIMQFLLLLSILPAFAEDAADPDSDEISFQFRTKFNRAYIPTQKKLICRRTPTPPKLDGKLDDPCWKMADHTKTAFVKIQSKEPNRRQTVVYTCFDDENIYLAYVCEEPELKKIRMRKGSGPMKRFRGVWADDEVEAFFEIGAVDGGGKLFQILVNPKACDDYYILTRDWDPTWEFGGGLGANRWIVEIAFPFEQFAFGEYQYKGPPVRGEVWGLKLNRVGKSLPNADQMGSCWEYNPYDTFHVIGHSGMLIFEDPNLLRNDGFNEDKNEDGSPDHWQLVKSAEDVEANLAYDEAEQAGRIDLKLAEGQVVQLRQDIDVLQLAHYIYSAKLNLDKFDGQAFLNIDVPPTEKEVARKKDYVEQKMKFRAEVGQTKAGVLLTLLGGSGTVMIDEMRVEERRNIIESGVVCLTGNAPQPHLNTVKTGGAYTYKFPGTDRECFPWQYQFSKSWIKGRPDEGGTEGWIQFNKGSITGRPTAADWPIAPRAKQLRGKPNGYKPIDIIFDFKKDYFIRQIDILPVFATLGNVHVYVRPESRKKYVHCAKLNGDGVLNPPGTVNYGKIEDIDSVGRYVKVTVTPPDRNIIGFGIDEIRIYGEEKGKHKDTDIKPFSWKQGLVVKTPPLPQLKKLETFIYPQPQEMKLSNDMLRISSATKIIAKDTGRILKFARQIQSELAERFMVELPVVEESSFRGELSNAIILGTPESSALVKELADREKLNVSKTEPGPQGYALVVNGRYALIAGSDEPGTFYGVQSLLQAVRYEGELQVVFQGMRVRDRPYIALRSLGGQTFTFHIEPPEMFERMTRGFARLKFNNFDVSPGWYYKEKEQHEKLIDYTRFADAHCMSYNLWMTAGPSLETGRGFRAEISTDENYKDITKTGGGRVNACPSEMHNYENYFDQMDGKSGLGHLRINRYVHIGLDEMYQNWSGSRWHICKKCLDRGLSGGELFAEHIVRIHDYMKRHNRETIGLNTVLQYRTTGGYQGMSNAYDMLPRDMVIDLYHSGDGEEHDPIYSFKSGFERIRPWYGLSRVNRSKAHNYYWPNTRIWGRQAWNWHGIWMLRMFGGSNPENAMRFIEGAWSPSNPPVHKAKFFQRHANTIIRFKELITGVEYPSWRVGTPKTYHTIDLRKHTNWSHIDDKLLDYKGWLDYGGNYDMRNLPKGINKFAGKVPFEILDPAANSDKSIVIVTNPPVSEDDGRFPNRAEIEVNRLAASLLILRTSFKTGAMPNYRVHYEGGGTMVVPMAGRDWRTTFGYADEPNTDPEAATQDATHRISWGLDFRCRPAWLGHTLSGDEISLYMFEWINPHPEKPIRSLEIWHDSEAPKTSHHEVLLAFTVLAPLELDRRIWESRDWRPPIVPNASPMRFKVAELAPLLNGATQDAKTEQWILKGKAGPAGTLTISGLGAGARNSPHHPWFGYANEFLTGEGITRNLRVKATPIIIELTTSAPICRIEALGQGRGGWTHDLQRTDYSVEVSMDGKNWTKVVNQKGITSEDGLQILDFDPIPSKWIKIGIEGEKYKRNQITAGLSRIQIYSPR